MARVNTKKAVEAWIKGGNFRAKGSSGSPIWTSGGVLFSYNTAIGKWSDADPHTAILNRERYSVTTSCQQNGVVQLLHQSGKRMIFCETEQSFRDTDRE